MQLFLLDKGYIFVMETKSAIELPSALRIFSKEVGVPIYLIVDPHNSNKSNEVRKFCHKIGTNLRFLEESNKHADVLICILD